MTKKDSQKKGLHIGIKILITVLIVLAVLALLIAIGGLLFFNHYYNKMDYVPLDTTEEIFYSIEDETDLPPVTDETPAKTGNSSGEINTGTPVTGENPITNAPDITEPPAVTEIPTVTEEPKERKEIFFSKNVINILLIGTDNREKDHRGRSDTMILLSINKDTKRIILTSFHRDIYLYIPTVHTYNKLNASYAYGGTSLLLKTIQRNFGLTIDKYARTDFWNFEEIIDLLGGVDIELSQEEINHMGLRGVVPGTVHLNGAQALKYVRNRSVNINGEGGDTGRAMRQRNLLGKLFEKAKTLSVSELLSLFDKILPLVTTNVTRSEALELVVNAPTYLKYDLVKMMIPIDGTKKTTYIRGMSVAVIDFDKNIAALENTIKGTN